MSARRSASSPIEAAEVDRAPVRAQAVTIAVADARGRRPARPHRPARRAVDAAARPARRRRRRRRPRAHDHDRRARERRGDQPVPRHAAARRRRARARATACPTASAIEPERRPVHPHRRRRTERRARQHDAAVPGRRRDRRPQPVRVGHGHHLGAGPTRPRHRRAGDRVRRRHPRRRLRRGRIQQLADHGLRDRARRPGERRRCSATSTCAATTCTVPTPGNGQANAVLRPRAGAATRSGSPIPSRRRVRSGPTSSRRRPQGLRALPLDGGSASSGRRSAPAPAARSSRTWSRSAGVSSEVGRRRGVHGHACAPPSRRASRTAARFRSRVSARNQAYPALATWTEAGGSGTPFGPPIAGGITVDGRRGGRRGHGVVGAVRRQRRRDRRLLRAAPRRRADRECPPGRRPARSRARPRRRRRPLRAAARVAEVVQVGAGCLERAVHRHGDRVDAVLVRRLGLQPCRPASNTEVAGIVVRPAPGARERRAERHGVDEPARPGTATSPGSTPAAPAPADRRRRRATAPRSASRADFRGTGWLRDPASNRAVRRDRAIPGARLLASGAAAARGRRSCRRAASAVAHVRAARAGCGTSASEDLVLDGARPTTPGCRRRSAAASTDGRNRQRRRSRRRRCQMPERATTATRRLVGC